MRILRIFFLVVWLVPLFTNCNSDLDRIHQFQKEETRTLNQNVETVFIFLKL